MNYYQKAKYFVKELLKISKALLKKRLIPKEMGIPGFIEKKIIANYPRKKVFTSCLLGRQILISDSIWYLPTLHEIWENQIYKFNAKSDYPLIIDCGANIGLSVIYWKYLYPNSKIIAFEPDPKIFELLQKNVEVFGFDDVDLRNFAVWSSEKKLNFQSDDSVGGRLIEQGNNLKLIKVKTFRLRDLLNQKIDMLKIDIEGAEKEVLTDCKDNFTLVENIFVEYHGKVTERQDLHEILELLQNENFRYHIKEANPVKHPFIKSELNNFYDLQLNIFAFRK